MRAGDLTKKWELFIFHIRICALRLANQEGQSVHFTGAEFLPKYSVEI